MRTLQDQLIKRGLTKKGDVRNVVSNVGNKRKEKLTLRELEEMMGVNRDIFRRGKGGSFRQR